MQWFAIPTKKNRITYLRCGLDKKTIVKQFLGGRSWRCFFDFVTQSIAVSAGNRRRLLRVMIYWTRGQIFKDSVSISLSSENRQHGQFELNRSSHRITRPDETQIISPRGKPPGWSKNEYTNSSAPVILKHQ